jgi:MoxR-like ATPase
MISVPMTHPSKDAEMRVLEVYNLPEAVRGVPAPLDPLTPEAITAAFEAIGAVHLGNELMSYVLDIAAATRDSSQVNLGLSTRGALALARCARIEASLRNAEYVVPDDVKRVAPWVIEHRLVLSTEATLEGMTPAQVVSHVLDNVEVPR